jgi:adenylate kinase
MARLTLYCERRGKSFNYHPTAEEAEALRMAAAKKEEEEAARLARVAAEREQREAGERQRAEEENAARKLAVLAEEKELVEAASLPLRSYLLSSVIPALVDGLLDVCKVQPDDPVDYLAEFLFKYSTAPAATTAAAAPTTSAASAAAAK